MGNPVWPTGLKVFTTFHDYTDVIFALSMNEVHDEIKSLENVLGVNPFNGTPYTSFAGAIQNLYVSKAPTTHVHTHGSLQNDNLGDDHTQYIRVDGSRGFQHPVAGQPATNNNQLVTLGQMHSLSYVNSGTVSNMIDAAIDNLLSGAFGSAALYAPSGPPSSPAWIVKGGTFTSGTANQCTDGNGIVTVSFGTGFPHGVQAFVATKIPPGAPPAAGCPNGNYNYIETQITLTAVTLSSVKVQFSHDYSWQQFMNVALTWLAIGW